MLDECPPPLRHWEWHYLKRLCGGSRITFSGHKARADCVAFSPDGKVIASGGFDLKIWDAATGKEIRSLGKFGEFASAVAFGPEGKLLVSGGTGPVKVWDVASGRELGAFGAYGGLAWCVAFSPRRELCGLWQKVQKE